MCLLNIIKANINKDSTIGINFYVIQTNLTYQNHLNERRKSQILKQRVN